MLVLTGVVFALVEILHDRSYEFMDMLAIFSAVIAIPVLVHYGMRVWSLFLALFPVVYCFDQFAGMGRWGNHDSTADQFIIVILLALGIWLLIEIMRSTKKLQIFHAQQLATQLRHWD